MNQLEVKEILDNEIAKECEKKAMNCSSLELDNNFNLLRSGVFDSLGILQLISKMEEELGGEVDLSEYSPSEFTNYAQLLIIFEEIDERKSSKIDVR